MTSASIDPTCRLTAALRAKESLRADRLYEDPFATHLTDDVGRAFLSQIEALDPDPGSKPCTVNFNAIRTRYFDDWLEHATRELNIPQVVLLAAGLDSRAYRLAWPAQLRWFEVDQAPAIAHKSEAFNRLEARPGVSLQRLVADLTEPFEEKLLAAGFRRDLPSVWLVEGLVYYLPEAKVRALLQTISKLACPGSVFGADFVNSIALLPFDAKAAQMKAIYAQHGTPWQSGCDDPSALLAHFDFAANVVQPGDPSANYGRFAFQFPPPSVPGVPRAFLVTAVRQ